MFFYLFNLFREGEVFNVLWLEKNLNLMDSEWMEKDKVKFCTMPYFYLSFTLHLSFYFLRIVKPLSSQQLHGSPLPTQVLQTRPSGTKGRHRIHASCLQNANKISWYILNILNLLEGVLHKYKNMKRFCLCNNEIKIRQLLAMITWIKPSTKVVCFWIRSPS